MEKKIIRAFQEDAAPKYLATLSKDGVPNVVPILSLDSINENTLVFGEYMIWKTKKNLLENKHVGCAVTDINGFKTYIVKGDFQEFIKTGDLVTQANMKPLFRYNAYTGVRSVGKISVTKIYPPVKLLSLSLLTNILKIKIGKGKVENYKALDLDEKVQIIHPRVIENFKGITSFKVLAFKDEDEYPMILPINSISPKKDRRRLVFSFSGFRKKIEKIPLMSTIAISIFKMKTEKNLISLALSKKIPLGEVQPIAYQVKGKFKGINRFRGVSLGVIDIIEIYSASPPIPGELISCN
ncbi:MAG: pyridoxamine 5'-phosphate oxidase family protein [Candidatus Helarchaeota archaeon]